MLFSFALDDRLFKLCPWGHCWLHIKGHMFHIELYSQILKMLLFETAMLNLLKIDVYHFVVDTYQVHQIMFLRVLTGPARGGQISYKEIYMNFLKFFLKLFNLAY